MTPEELTIWIHAQAEIDSIEGEDCMLPDGTRGQIRVVSDQPRVCLAWQTPDWEIASTMQLRVIPRQVSCEVSFHQERLPDRQAREERDRFLSSALDRMKVWIGGLCCRAGRGAIRTW
jgi:hypothetical protein